MTGSFMSRSSQYSFIDFLRAVYARCDYESVRSMYRQIEELSMMKRLSVRRTSNKVWINKSYK